MSEKSIKFSDYKEQIINAINSKLPMTNISEEVSLIEGFINQPIHDEITKDLVIGGSTIPIIATVGKKSGQLYFFALKALIPDLEI